MNRLTSLAFAILCVAACARSSARPQAQRAARAHSAARPAALPAMPSAAEHEAEEQRELMEAVRGMSAFAPDDEGARGFVAAFARECAAHDREGIERFERELVADRRRFDLALDFEGARQLRDRVIPTIEPGVRAIEARLGSLRGPLTITVRSALGRDFADGQAHGFNPGITAVKAHLRGAVRFHRVEVASPDGQRVVIEPMAFLAGRWTWLGEPWSAVAPTAPATPVTGPAGGAAAR